ncbi:FAD-dependent monooxygenase [Hydrogenophaga laconesensis]|uniref:2-polyprenyl-6-methoxyphenol hydroxylase-like FAD-dependent oxidoreductase n=1 Tax=Hydrogenophaga laconesensis TaxID=1805971 RepID=A0ABU1VEJ5_9BURK|nr:FAD-dependent monooxygenase [Hydrogenophaga laconesensis]MDR7095884.1 2-polyprenyl-6-methoxyphenol hydroxylase-like FAD-dependent oxidoreductase [Hydrogenophaga laconesensis]
MNSPAPRPGAARRFDVTIRGAGVVGQTLALLLARDRLRVALVGTPRSPQDAPDVRAYAINAASRDLLRSVRAWPEVDPQDLRVPPITPVCEMQVWGDDGGELQFSAEDQGADALTWIVDVPALEQRLSDAVGFQGGIERMTEAPPAALTVVCEGKRSQTRDELGLDFDVRPYPHKAVAARLHCDQPHGGIARQWFADGEVMALLPLGGISGNSVALVWSVPAQQADTWLQADPTTFTQAVQARCAHALGHMHMESPAQAWPLERSRARRWIARTPQGGVALAGDAAHAMHPLAGQGLNVGLADAAELARVLQQREYWRDLGDLKLLRRYERARAAEVGAMGWVTDGLFSLFSQGDSRLQALRNWGLSGFDRSGPLKRWIARQAMGQPGM